MEENSLSVVSVCFNNLDELKTTIQSVDSQQRLPEEHLIIDGSTNTEIRDYLEKNSQPSYRRWICERDKGISDAFNKGVSNARSKVIHLLNSGDYYFNEQATTWAMQAFENDDRLMWLHGKYAQFRGGAWVLSGTLFEPKLLYKGMRQLGHQTFFVQKKMYEKHGNFSLSLKMAMDYDFIVRIAQEKFTFIDQPITVFTPGGVSSNQFKNSLTETRKIYEHYHGFSLKTRLWMLRSFLLAWFTNSTALGKFLFQLKNKKNISE